MNDFVLTVAQEFGVTFDDLTDKPFVEFLEAAITIKRRADRQKKQLKE